MGPLSINNTHPEMGRLNMCFLSFSLAVILSLSSLSYPLRPSPRVLRMSQINTAVFPADNQLLILLPLMIHLPLQGRRHVSHERYDYEYTLAILAPLVSCRLYLFHRRKCVIHSIKNEKE